VSYPGTRHYMTEPDGVRLTFIQTTAALNAMSHAGTAEHEASMAKHYLRDLYWFAQPSTDEIADKALLLSRLAECAERAVVGALDEWADKELDHADDAAICWHYVERAMSAYAVARYFAVYVRDALNIAHPGHFAMRHCRYWDNLTDAELQHPSYAVTTYRGPQPAGF
jgi:hypothetical protein